MKYFGLDVIGGVFRDVIGIFADGLKHKRQLKEAEVLSRIQFIQNAQLAEINWDNTAQQNAGSSWKDEWFVLLLSFPLVGAFVPNLQPYVEQGFQNLDAMPDYYKAFLATAVSASFGYKALAKPFVEKLAGRSPSKPTPIPPQS
ncbi:MAG: hypothetical protein MK081_13320 [Flavobacteriales bacterium]|nr:hypothetical protein [Flavobacteriales bacterium]